MKFLKGFLITIAVIVVIAALVLGYFGFVPGISNLFGSNQARDLGVTYTSDDYVRAHLRNGTTHTVLPPTENPEDSITFTGQHEVSTTYSQAEFNALINYREWEYYPLTDLQLRINDDDSLEFSGVIITSRLEPYMQAMDVSEDNMQMVMDYIKYIPGNAAFYAKGNLEIANGQFVNTDIDEFQVGNVSLTNQAQDNLYSLMSGAASQMNAYPGFKVKTLKFADGKVQFEGTLPDSARTVVTN